MPRPKGSPNVVTSEAKELFALTMAGEIEKIEQAFEEIRENRGAVVYLNVLARYIKYFLPIPKPEPTEDDWREQPIFCFEDVIKKVRGDKE